MRRYFIKYFIPTIGITYSALNEKRFNLFPTAYCINNPIEAIENTRKNLINPSLWYDAMTIQKQHMDNAIRSHGNILECIKDPKSYTTIQEILRIFPHTKEKFLLLPSPSDIVSFAGQLCIVGFLVYAYNLKRNGESVEELRKWHIKVAGSGGGSLLSGFIFGFIFGFDPLTLSLGLVAGYLLTNSYYAATAKNDFFSAFIDELEDDWDRFSASDANVSDEDLKHTNQEILTNLKYTNGLLVLENKGLKEEIKKKDDIISSLRKSR
jgi:hypothetical protein